jgi:WD40-like Beta Propeller Repeat
MSWRGIDEADSARKLVRGPLPLRACLLTALLLVAAPPSSALADLPAQGWVVWASNRQDGRHEIYQAREDGTDVRQLTFKGGTLPEWSPDGRWIAYTGPNYTTRVIHKDGVGDKAVCQGMFAFWLLDGRGLVCLHRGSYSLVDPDQVTSTPLFQRSDFTQVSKALNVHGLTRDGRYAVATTDQYRQGHTGTNGTFTATWAAVILDLQHLDRLYFLGSGCEPTVSPVSDLLYHVAEVSSTTRDIYSMDLADLKTRRSYRPEIASSNTNWGYEYFPRVSTDGQWLAYGASSGCHDHELCDYEIFIHRLGASADSHRRITWHTSNDRWPHLYVPAPPPASCAAAAGSGDDVPTWLLVLFVAPLAWIARRGWRSRLLRRTPAS